MPDEVYTLVRGRRPLLISLPHAGFHIPEALRPHYLPRALGSEDTDWHLEAVYAPLAEALGASLLVARLSRYVVDLNRPAEDVPMYPGVNNTGLCPLSFFDGSPIYREGQAPDAAERQRRVQRYWQPYHQALAAEMTRLQAEHGRALLWDGHSIESELPWLFEGRLPDFNLGSNNGASCASAIRDAVAARLAAQQDFSQVVDGRFKGGYITRHYGRPAQGWQALQMEMVQASYMLEDKDHAPPRPLIESRTAACRELLGGLLQTYLGAAA